MSKQIVLIACLSVVLNNSVAESSTSPGISEFDSVSLGYVRDQVQKVWGEPTEKKSLSKDGSEIWSYKRKVTFGNQILDIDKATFFFDPSSGRLRSKNYFPDENESVYNVKTIQTKYRANFKRYTQPMCGHFQSSDIEYLDSKKGLYVSATGKGEVELIGWSLPSNRKPASQSTDCSKMRI